MGEANRRLFLMGAWQQLFSEFEAAAKLREQHSAATAREFVDFESRCARAETEVMSALAMTLAERAEEFHARGVGRMKVTYPSHPPLIVPQSDLSMRFLAIELGPSEVDLYTHRRRGSLPWIHFCYRRTDDSRPLLVSMAGAMVALNADGFALLRPPVDGRPAEPSSLDDVALRVMQLLLGAERGRWKHARS